MRVIAGKYKKSNLFSVPGKTSRPTTDYIKELLFSVIQDCQDQHILDLYAGSGGISFEALSRGAKFATMVDFSDKAISTMKKNIAKLGCSESCRIHKKRATSFLQKTEQNFDLIFMDPPYEKNLVNKTLQQIVENERLNPAGKVIIEHSFREQVAEKYSAQVSYHKKCGETAITILEF
ncbi:MAG: 16S rRNA (guanine(966)-N(2))-methyltransferase RsmD [Candidatus Cloacimonadales bacterium]